MTPLRRTHRRAYKSARNLVDTVKPATTEVVHARSASRAKHQAGKHKLKCMYVYLCMQTYLHTEIQAYRQMDGRTAGHSCKHTYKNTYISIHTPVHIYIYIYIYIYIL